MKEKNQVFIGVTVGQSQVDDLFLAIGLVDGVEVVHTAKAYTPRNKRHKGKEGLAKLTQAKLKPVEPSAARSAAIKAGPKVRAVANLSQQKLDDPRVVYHRNERGTIVLDVDATLANIGLTAAQLDAMDTRQGTVENSVKRSLSAQRGSRAVRRTV